MDEALRRLGANHPRVDPAVLAQVASATLHSIAIRSRTGVSRKELEAIVKGAIDVMVGKKA